MTKQSIFFYIENHGKNGEIALSCRVLGVTPQVYRKHIQMKNKPYKYTQLLADIATILQEDIYNSSYGKQRMYEKFVQKEDDLLQRDFTAEAPCEKIVTDIT